MPTMVRVTLNFRAQKDTFEIIDLGHILDL